MPTDQEYVDYARECVRLVALDQDQQRDKLLDMAREWMAVEDAAIKLANLGRFSLLRSFKRL